ncbi:MAG: hypothetical protein FD153_1956, partial [Rhodospirillaceae bacterium]
MGGFAFTAPLALLLLLALPAMWWLLQVIPPAARRVPFPAVRFLRGLETGTTQHEAARIPWGLLLLRLVVAVLVIVAMAHPIVGDQSNLEGHGTVVLAIDDGWAAAADWAARRAVTLELLNEAERTARPVMLLTTAPPADGGVLAATSVMRAGSLKSIVWSLNPKPWPVDRGAAISALNHAPPQGSAHAVWLADGVEDGHAAAFAARLQRLGGLTVVHNDKAAVRLLLPAPPMAGDLGAMVHRAVSGKDTALAEVVFLRALDETGHVLARQALPLAAGSSVVQGAVPLPATLRNQVVRLDLEEGAASAATVILLDARWGRRMVRLVSGTSSQAAVPLVSDLYYLERALEPMAEVQHGTIADPLSGDLSTLVLAD